MNVFKKKNLAVLVLACGVLASGAVLVFAADAPNVSVNIPGSNAPDKGVPGIVANIYEFSLMIGVLLAFGVIVYAGIKYTVSAGNPSAQSDARDHILQALLGLLLLLGASIVLGTVNPRLTQLFLPTLTQIEAPPPTALVSSAAAETQARTTLRQAGIGINKNPCPDGQRFQDVPGGCTNVAGLSPSTIATLTKLHTDCGCVITITGGTELGHKDHGPGIPVVDLAFDTTLGDYLNSHRQSLAIQAVCTTNADSHYRFNCSTNEEVQHFHVKFSQ